MIIVYFAIKSYVEKNFARPVFWGSTKLVMIMLILGLLNLSFFFLLPSHIGVLGTIVYFLFIPFAGFTAYKFMTFMHALLKSKKIKKMDVSDLLEVRSSLVKKIKEITPV